MSHQGSPDYGAGYNGQYGPIGGYPGQQQLNESYSQQPVAQLSSPYAQGGMSAQQAMEQEAHNRQAYYQNQQRIREMGQYNQMNYAPMQQNYYQSPSLPVQQQQYAQPQYVDPRHKSQYIPVRTPYGPQFDGSLDPPTNSTPLNSFRHSHSHQQQHQQHQQQHQQQPQSAPQPQRPLQPLGQPSIHHPISTSPIPAPPVKHRSPTQVRKPSTAAPAPVDPHTLLPPLAEEYFGAAHSMGGVAAHGTGLEQYQKLIATGLGCLEAALNEGRLEPRMEAKVRLRYAGVLVEETDNMMEAETALSKGISLCEQNRFFDMKYSMQVLLAKLLFSKNPKAALIALDGNIEEVEAYQHHSWIYIFRFLRATLSLQTGKSSDFHVAINNLHQIAERAGRRSDYAVVTYASLLEALACLRTPGPESMENLNRALAAAQTYQLSPECNIPTLKVFAHMLGVISSLLHDNNEKTFEKLKTFQQLLNETAKDKAWPSKSDAILIPLIRNKSDAQVSSMDTKGLLDVGEDGRDVLVFSFINKQDAFMIGFLLAGVARIHVKIEDVTPMKYLRDGLMSAERAKSSKRSGPLSLIQENYRKEKAMICYLYIFIIFRAIFTTDWKAAKDSLTGLQLAIAELGEDTEPTIDLLFTHLTAMYYQGTGAIEEALHLYQDEVFSLPDPDKFPQTPDHQVRRDISIVATMNSLLILNSLPNPDIQSNTALLDRLKPFCLSHPNVDIQTAYHILLTVITTSPPTSQLATKSYMRSALTGAKKRGNFHLVCITLNVMCTRFFVNIIGEQSIKSAMAAREQSLKSGNRVWMSAATGLLARSMEIEGKGEQAERMAREAVRLAEGALVVPN